MTKSTFIKRRYFDLRMGNTTIAPILQLSNFLMLSYLTISNVIPFYVFVPLFIIGVLASMTIVGSKFRSHQMPTDINMSYEKATEAGKTMYLLMKAIDDIKKQDEEFQTRMEYVRKIGNGKV